MPVPSNISFGTAIDIGSSFPYSNSQGIDDSGTYYTVYYKITSLSEQVLGFFFYGDSANYLAQLTVYESDQTTVYLDLSPVENRAIQMPLAAAATYYFKIVAGGTNVSTATLTVSVVEHSDSTPITGDLLIPDDTSGFPATINDQSGGTVREFIIGYAAGEQGVILNNGYSCICDIATETLRIYNASYVETQNLDLFPGASLGLQGCVGSNKVDTFYVGTFDVSNAPVKKVFYDGTVLATYALSTNAIKGMDVDNGETILYYNNGGKILRWDIVNNMALSDLVAAIATYVSREMKVLSDDTILVKYEKVNSCIVKQYSTAGAVLNTYDFGSQNSAVTPARIDVGSDNPDSFWIFMHDNLNTILQHVRISDGAILTSISVPSFESGIYADTPTASPLARFGASASCPLMVLQDVPVTLSGGLYVETGTQNRPATTFDELFTGDATTESVKIPDPTVIIYPAGD